MLVDQDGARLAVGLGGNEVITLDVSAELGLSPDAQEQRMAATRADNDLWVIAGPLGTEVLTPTESQVIDPLPGRLPRLFGHDGMVAAVDTNLNVDTLDVSDLAAVTMGNAPRPLVPGSHGHAIAMGEEGLLTWNGAPSAEGWKSGNAFLSPLPRFHDASPS